MNNPYLPDAILNEVYVSFDHNEERNQRSLEVQLEPVNYFTDASFQSDGIEILYRLLKVLTLSHKITNDWMETGILRLKRNLAHCI